MCMCRLLTWAILATSTVVAFTCPIKSAVSCNRCNTSGVLSFDVSVDGSGQKANVTCCPLGGFQTGVYVQRSNQSNVNLRISYLPRDGYCDGLALPLTELHCSFYLVCRIAPIGSNKTEEVRVAVKDAVSSFTNSDPSSAKIDALQYCQCSQIKVDVTSSISFINSTVEKLSQMTTLSNLITLQSKGGGPTPVIAGTIVTMILILTALLIALIVAVAAWNRNKESKPQPVQISRDEQQEKRPLIALLRIITSHTQGKIDANSSQVESPPKVDLQPFVLPKEFEPSDLSRNPAEGEQYSAVQCTNINPSSSGVVFYTGGNLIQPKPGSMTFAKTFIPEGTSV